MSSTITPKDLLDVTMRYLDERRGEWVAPGEVWSEVQRVAPGLAERVDAKIRAYKDPVRNNAVWFISNTLYHVAKRDRFELSDKERVPDMKGKTLWLVVRAKP